MTWHINAPYIDALMVAWDEYEAAEAACGRAGFTEYVRDVFYAGFYAAWFAKEVTK